MRYSDRPINRPNQDILGRAPFALELARAIDRLEVAKDGFVIAIIGEWGSGKSSVIELIIHYLRHIEMERASQAPVLDDRVPHPRSIDQLEELSEAYEKIKDHVSLMEAENKNLTYWEATNRRKDFLRWCETETEADLAERYWRIDWAAKKKTIVVRFSPWLISGRAELAAGLLSELARSLEAPLGDEIKNAFAAILQRLSQFAPIAGAGLDAATGLPLGKVLSLGVDTSSKFASQMTSGPTLDELRNRLRGLLARLEDQQVLVVVDDLDRLVPTEALEMVSLVKSLGDLPNVIYLLSYDDVKLSELVERAIEIDGHAFLEKIIQYPVALPPLAEADLVQLLNNDVQELIGVLSPEDMQRLGEAWHFVLQHYLLNPRDVRRVINSYSVAISAVRDYTDPIDLLILELLKLQEPDLYWWIRRNIHELAD